MPSITKLALSSLALLAYSADAAPLLTGLGGSANGNANAAVFAGVKTDLKVFADACVKVTTGGKTNSCDNVNLGLVSSLTTSLRASLFSKLAVTQCVASYSDVVGCTEFGAYLAVSYYAYISGWAGATLFAALEPARVDRWHSLLDGFCGAPGAPAGVCGGWINEWNTFAQASGSVSAQIKAAATLNLRSSGLLNACDSSAILKAGVDGIIRIGAAATADAKVILAADVKADVKAKADVAAAAVVDVTADVKAKADVAAGAVVDVAADVKAKADAAAAAALNVAADVKAKADVAAVAAVGVTADVKGKVDATAAAALDASAKLAATAAADAKAALAAAAALKANVDVKADVDVHANAKTGAILHRELLDIVNVVGGLQGEGKGNGFLGLTGDRLDLGLAGAGKGKGFLGAIIA